MNVLVLFTYGMSFEAWDKTGLLDREIKLYNNISKVSNVQYTFLTYGNSKDLEYEVLLENSKIYPLYAHHKYYENKIVRIFHTIFLAYLLRKNFKYVNLIKTNQLMGSWIGIILKTFNKTPLLVRTGYDIFTFSRKNKKSLIKIAFFYVLTQICLIYSNLYTVTSLVDKKILEKYFFVKNEKISVVSNWVEYNKNNKDFSLRSKNKILSIGRLESQKNYEFLITELSNTNIELDIYGTGTLDNKLKDIANSKNVTVNFLGNISNKELIEKMQNYKIFCLMSKFEGNPKVVLEAMSNGCVCVLSNIQNNAEIITNGKNGFLLNIENNCLSNLLPNLLNSDNRLNIISNNARKTILDNFTLEKAIEIELFNYSEITKV